MGRALSLSAVAHLAFAVSFLLLSATRKPLVIPQVSRPVRLVAYLEAPSAASPKGPAPTVAEPAAPRPQAPALPRPQKTAASTTRATAPVRPSSSAAPRVAAVAVPSVGIPLPPPREPSPAAPPEATPSLADRMARRLPPPPAGRPPAAPPIPQPVDLARPVPPVPSSTSLPSAGETRPPVASGASPGDENLPGYLESYIAEAKKMIYERWTPPSEYFQRGRSPVALVSFRVDRAGRVSRIKLREASGDGRYDDSALAVVRALGQVSPLPEQYHEETLDVVINFQMQR